MVYSTKPINKKKIKKKIKKFRDFPGLSYISNESPWSELVKKSDSSLWKFVEIFESSPKLEYANEIIISN